MEAPARVEAATHPANARRKSLSRETPCSIPHKSCDYQPTVCCGHGYHTRVCNCSDGKWGCWFQDPKECLDGCGGQGGSLDSGGAPEASGDDAAVEDAPSADAQGDQSAEAGDDAEAGAPAEISIELPPGFAWCKFQDCGSQQVVVRVCESAGCQPAKSAVMDWTINGQAFDRLGLLVTPLSGPCSTSVESGPGSMFWQFAMVSGASSARLETDACEAEVTHYHLAVPWNGTLHIPFQATGYADSRGSSWFFRYSGYDPQVEHPTLHGQLSGIAKELVQLLDVDPVVFQAWLMPTELAIPLGGEGNFSMGNGLITVNYGNPDWIAAMGGATALILHEFSHEYTHELFLPVSSSYVGNNTCLNEGIADAVGNSLGYVPDADFCPDSGAGCAYAAGCGGITEIHAAGNCVLWNVKNAGLLDANALRKLFHPSRIFSFDSCDFGSDQTGNSLVVMFTEASGQDSSDAVTAMGIPHAGSYAAAKAALGW